MAENKILAITFTYDGFTDCTQVYPIVEEAVSEADDEDEELKNRQAKYIYAFKVTKKGNIIIATTKLIFLKEISHGEYEEVPQEDENL